MLGRRERRTEAASVAASPSAYDEVAYRGLPFAQTHPDRLLALVTLFGGRPRAVGECRVLELGCGDGGNLLPMAELLPGARFLGIDLNAAAISRAREDAAAIGLTNVTFEAADLTSVDPRALGRFDAVIAHGVYSWVPAPAREAVLGLCGACLDREGAAFVSFNALPGGRLRQAIRDVLVWETRDAPTAERRIAAARAVLADLARREPWGAVKAPLDLLARLDDSVVFHDDLAAVSEPFAIADVAARAADHRLRYLCDAELHECAVGAPADVRAELAGHGGVVAREQAFDNRHLRMFRQAILVPAAARAASEPDAGALRRLRFAVDPSRIPSRPGTGVPTLDRALRRLGAAWPRRLPFDEVADAAGEGAVNLAPALLEAARARLVSVHAWEPAFATRDDTRPVAPRYARLRAGAGMTVTTLRHTPADLDERTARLVALLDGTRDVAALAEALGLRGADRTRLGEQLARLAEGGLLLTADRGGEAGIRC